jgi:MFS family permease
MIQFWLGLALLGVGWNFLYVGGSALLTETYRPEEMSKVQGLNDFLVTSVTAVTALSSGAIFVHFGWGILTGVAVLPLLLVFLAILWTRKNHAMAS